MEILKLFNDKVDLECVESVIGSGYEALVADLALRDKVAYRAARKNMQIHSAIILKINNEFSGFFTFQINHDEKEIDRLKKILHELDGYERDVLYPLATQQIEIDLDDGVKTNYPKFGEALKKIPGLKDKKE